VLRPEINPACSQSAVVNYFQIADYSTPINVLRMY
jgi:hypothetical protein